MAKQLMAAKIDPATLKGLKSKGKKLVKTRQVKSYNEMIECALTSFLNTPIEEFQYSLT